MTSIVVLDALKLASEYDLFEALNEQFRFPVYFGWNWDAVLPFFRKPRWAFSLVAVFRDYQVD